MGDVKKKVDKKEDTILITKQKRRAEAVQAVCRNYVGLCRSTTAIMSILRVSPKNAFSRAEEHKRARLKVEVGVRLALEARQRV